MKNLAKSTIKLLTVFTLLAGCSDEPTAGTPAHNQPDMDMSMNGGDGGVVDTDMLPDMEEPVAKAQRLVLQPVSGSGSIKSAKFKAHIQIGRIVDATSK